MGPHDQHGADVRFDWGRQGLVSLLDGGVRTVVVVDVLRFTTAVDVACGRGAAVTPYGGDDDAAAAEEAARRGALLATRAAAGGDTTSPSLLTLPIYCGPAGRRNSPSACRGCDRVPGNSSHGSSCPTVNSSSWCARYASASRKSGSS